MSIEIFQNNNLLHLTVDTWQDEVFFNGVAYPAGYFATSAGPAIISSATTSPG